MSSTRTSYATAPGKGRKPVLVTCLGVLILGLGWLETHHRLLPIMPLQPQDGAKMIRLLMQLSLVTLIGAIATAARPVQRIALPARRNANDIAPRADTDPAMFAALLDGQDAEVVVVDAASHRVLFASTAARARFQWDSDPAGLCLAEAGKPQSELGLYADHIRHLDDGILTTYTRVSQNDRTPIDIQTRRRRLPDGTDVFISLIEPVTTLRISHTRLTEISHEFRTPLASIKGSLRLLEAGSFGPVPRAADEAVTIAIRNTDRLLTLANAILDLDRPQIAEADACDTRLDLPGLVDEVAAEMAGFATEHGVDVRCEDMPATAHVNGNAEKLKQVMTNLVSNAVKFSPQGAQVRIHLSDQTAFWRIRVQDFGPGLAESDRARVFQSFGRATPGDGIARDGSGLGLAITRKIVRQHGGNIDFTSQPGQGAEFYVDLPKAMMRAPQVAPQEQRMAG